MTIKKVVIFSKHSGAVMAAGDTHADAMRELADAIGECPDIFDVERFQEAYISVEASFKDEAAFRHYLTGGGSDHVLGNAELGCPRDQEIARVLLTGAAEVYLLRMEEKEVVAVVRRGVVQSIIPVDADIFRQYLYEGHTPDLWPIQHPAGMRRADSAPQTISALKEDGYEVLGLDGKFISKEEKEKLEMKFRE